MFTIGFELEIASAHSRDEIKSLLKKAFPGYKKIQVVDDCTIGTTNKMRFAHEIVTPPLPSDEAFQLLEALFEFMHHNKCASNKTTGLHVNVSFSDKPLNKWLNPIHVVDNVPYKEILSRWGREKNRYCRSMDYYFDIIQSRVKILYKPKKWTDHYAMCEYSHDEVQRMSEIKFISMISDCCGDNADSYTNKAYDIWDDGQGKHVCMNLHYLKQRGYIEFRMIGGAKYLTSHDEVVKDINKILAGMLIAINRSMDNENR